jgi:hypothetical protein
VIIGLLDYYDYIIYRWFVGHRLRSGARSFPSTPFVENTPVPQADGFMQSVSHLLGTFSPLLVSLSSIIMPAECHTVLRRS